jgi:hypothetical protein
MVLEFARRYGGVVLSAEEGTELGKIGTTDGEANHVCN